MLTKNGCGSRNTGEVTLNIRQQLKKKRKKTHNNPRERLIKVNVQTLSPVSNPFPCKSFTDVR